MEQLQNIEFLLNEAGKIVKHQKEVSRLRGENFNIFSILKMETKENATHSAFIHELLNPKGSHLLGSVFLKLFLEQIKYPIYLDFNLDSAQTNIEHHISQRDDDAKTGGRIDILIWDKYNNFISIENKIDAGDQDYQIERYVNFNKGNNVVYYLTKEGLPASDISKGELKEERDYFCISYSYTIISWLENCIKEAVTQPILRETINQYIILIKRLTNQLTDQSMATQIEELIIKNYINAKVIQKNINNAELNGVYTFVNALANKVKNELSKGLWEFKISGNPTDAYGGFIVWHKDWPDNVHVKFEGESRIAYNQSLCGIVAHKSNFDRKTLDIRLSKTNFCSENRLKSAHFPCYKFVLDLRDDLDREKVLFNKDGYQDKVVKEIATEIVNLAKETEELLKGIVPIK
jgi:PD-(D/E)XK nuclease superfamily protein